MSQATRGDIGLLAVLGAIWGTSFMAIKAGLDHFDPLFFAALRYDLAAAIMVAVAVWWPRPNGQGTMGLRSLIPATDRQWRAVIVSAALNVLAYHAFLFWGEQFTTSAVAAVIIALNPVAATVMSRLFLPGDHVDARGLIGILLGIGGIAALVGLKPGDLLDARGIGELAITGSIVSWSLGAVYLKRLGHRMPVVPFTATQMAIGALMLHAVSLVFEGTTPRWDHNAPALAALLYLSVLGSAVGFLIYFTLLDRVGPIRSSLVSYLAPVAAAVSGWLVLGEVLEPRAVVAFVAIAAGFRLVVGRLKVAGDKDGPPIGKDTPSDP